MILSKSQAFYTHKFDAVENISKNCLSIMSHGRPKIIHFTIFLHSCPKQMTIIHPHICEFWLKKHFEIEFWQCWKSVDIENITKNYFIKMRILRVFRST